MKIKKIVLDSSVEQNLNKKIDSTNQLFEDLKRIYLEVSPTRVEFKNKIELLRSNIKNIKSDIDTKNELIEKLRDTKKEAQKQFEKLDLEIYTIREDLLNVIGSEL